MNKFFRGDRVFNVKQGGVGLVLGEFLDYDNVWYVVYRSSREFLFISPRSDLEPVRPAKYLVEELTHQ